MRLDKASGDALDFLSLCVCVCFGSFEFGGIGFVPAYPAHGFMTIHFIYFFHFIINANGTIDFETNEKKNGGKLLVGGNQGRMKRDENKHTDAANGCRVSG